MTFLQLCFYAFSLILVFAAVMVVTIRNPVKAALFLVLAFFSAACIWVTLQAEFLSLVLVLVYVGAVMVLFLFVVMMLDVDLTKLKSGALKAGLTQYLPIGSVIAVLMAAEIAFVMHISFTHERLINPANHTADYSNSKALGRVIYTDYVYAFEIAALILLVAIIAAITLTMRRRADTKYINPSEQVRVKREDRLKIVKMESVPVDTAPLDTAPTDQQTPS